MEYFHLKANVAATLLWSEKQSHLLFLQSTKKLDLCNYAAVLIDCIFYS